jgi:hypothetical protein
MDDHGPGPLRVASKMSPRRGVRSGFALFTKRTPRVRPEPQILQNELPRGGWTRRFAKRTPLGLRRAAAAQRLTQRTQSSFARVRAQTRRVARPVPMIFNFQRPSAGALKGTTSNHDRPPLVQRTISSIEQGCAGVAGIARWRLAQRRSNWTTSRLDSITRRRRNRPAETNRRW